jgi:uncharacterized protein (DUF433 family)
MTTFVGFDRITSDLSVMGGQPCVRGMRLTVQRVLEILAERPTDEELRADYPELTEEDVREVLAFAAASLGERVIPMTAA